MEPATMPEIGQLVIWHDNLGNANNALVIYVFPSGMINVVLPEPSGERTDIYGRQLRRETSVPYLGAIHGLYWRYPEDDPNPPVKPTAT